MSSSPAGCGPGGGSELLPMDHSAYRHCTLCPWTCGVDRSAGETGKCAADARLKVADTMAHFGEEACLVGRGGSGAVFFSHCTLRCVFCQTAELSLRGDGLTVDSGRLARAFLRLQEEGCENINLIGADHYLPHLLEALETAKQKGLRLPVIYNCSGFQRLETLRELRGWVDIYLPDFKFWQAETAAELCGARSYPEVARAALTEMHRQVGDLELDRQGRARRGILVRHLVLPGYLTESRDIFHWIAGHLSRHTAVNVMGHFRPCHQAKQHSGLTRPLSAEEYERVRQWALDAGLVRLDRSHDRLYHLIWTRTC